MEFSETALEQAADMAIRLKTGARGLRSILEEALMEPMYHAPSMPDVVKCYVDEKAIAGKRSATLITSNGRALEARADMDDVGSGLRLDTGLKEEKTA